MTIHVRLLGRFEVTVSNEKIPDGAFGDRKSRALLRMLTCHRGSVLTKDFIADALWGEDQPKDSGASIDVLVSRVRKVLGDPALIRSVSGGLVLSDSDQIEIDAESFRESVLQGRHYFAAEHWAQAKSAFDEALGRWGGEPMPEDAYSEWAAHLRRELTGLYVEALEGGARASLMLRDWAAAVELSEKAVELEPLREMSNMLLVSAQARAGDQVAALEAFHRYRTRLVDELGLDPSKEAYEIQSQILQGMRQESLELLSHLVPGEARLRSRQALSGKSSAPMRARTLASMAMLAAGSDDYARASELIDLAMPDARDDPRALSEVLYVGSIIDMNLGELDRARSRANEALGHFEMLGDALGIANILDGRAMATFLDGQIAEGVAAFQRVARLFEESADIPRMVTPLSTRGHGLVFMGRAEEGLTETRRALDLAEDLEDLEGRAYAHWHCSEALTALTLLDDAVKSAEESLRIAEEIEHREWTAASLRALGIAHFSAGRLEDALTIFQRGAKLSRGILLFETWHCCHVGRTMLALERPDEARPWVEKALRGGPPLGLFEARLAQVELLRAEADNEADAVEKNLRMDASRVGYEQVINSLDRIHS